MYLVPDEFDLSAAHGFSMRGWNFSADEVRNAIATHRMLNPAMELGSNVCPWNCDFCFTESPVNPDGRKRKLSGELPLARRLRVIDEAAALGTRSINFVGAGEPTIDPGFWKLLERMAAQEIVPIVYTEASLKLTNYDFCQRLFDLGATVVLKVNSLYNRAYQDQVLRGVRPKPGVPTCSYTDQRQIALDNLIKLGFNKTVPTRLAFDTIICKENVSEIGELHRHARRNNIFVLLVTYLPSGRTIDGHTSAISWQEQQDVFEKLAAIDREEFGIFHRTKFPYAGGVPCTIRGLGVFVKIQGDVFDCPGEMMRLGNLNDSSLAELWERARAVTESFDGECKPRQEAARKRAGVMLPILPHG